eukprot:13949116-Heterocapsa_arctica.AAC.1
MVLMRIFNSELHAPHTIPRFGLRQPAFRAHILSFLSRTYLVFQYSDPYSEFLSEALATIIIYGCVSEPVAAQAFLFGAFHDDPLCRPEPF